MNLLFQVREAHGLCLSFPQAAVGPLLEGIIHHLIGFIKSVEMQERKNSIESYNGWVWFGWLGLAFCLGWLGWAWV